MLLEKQEWGRRLYAAMLSCCEGSSTIAEVYEWETPNEGRSVLDQDGRGTGWHAWPPDRGRRTPQEALIQRCAERPVPGAPPSR
jgi:hypothetical protein